MHHRHAHRLRPPSRRCPAAPSVVAAARGDAGRQRQRRSRAPLRPRHHHPVLLVGGAGTAPTIIDTSASWFSAVGAASPTVRPWRSTTARSATCATCSRLCEIRITATPCSGSRRDELEHLARLAQAERGGRLVEDHERAGERDRAQHRDRLPLAARQHADRWRGSTGCRPPAARAARVPVARPSRARAAARAGRASAARRSSRPMRKFATRAEVVEQPRGPGAASRCRRRASARASAASTGRPSIRISPSSSAVDAADRLDQRRLAGAVVAEQRDAPRPPRRSGRRRPARAPRRSS